MSWFSKKKKEPCEIVRTQLIRVGDERIYVYKCGVSVDQYYGHVAGIVTDLALAMEWKQQGYNRQVQVIEAVRDKQNQLWMPSIGQAINLISSLSEFTNE